MGNFKDIETEFIERTLLLISQYEGVQRKFQFEEQFNHTLLINCLLGIIVLPKERTMTYIPPDRLTEELRTMMGLRYSWINPELNDLRSLILALRNSVAHFDIKVISLDERFLIDQVIFYDNVRSEGFEVAKFSSDELLPFVRYYASWLLSNIKKYRPVEE
jgi:HEPN pEK499 p136